MSNEIIRERLAEYVKHCRTPYTKIASDMGIGSPSRYLLSRFLKGRQLNAVTLTLIDSYLKERGY